MNILNVISTYSCPIKCNFCYNKNKCNDATTIDIQSLNIFLENNHKHFDKIIITGGEPSLLPKKFMEDVYNSCSKYLETEIQSYLLSNNNLVDDAKYVFSYDFIARPRVRESWSKLLEYKKPFDLMITMSPLIFKYYPNKILQILTILPNLKKVIFKPYFKTPTSQYEIENRFYKKFVDIVKDSKLNIKYDVEFDDRFYGKEVNEYILTPECDLNIVQFDNDIRYERRILEEEIGKYKTNYPENILL